MTVPDPWKALARTDLALVRAPIPEMGRYYHDLRIIVVRMGLLLVQERATLWHELVHARRGDARCSCDWLAGKQEDSVDREAARHAMPIGCLIEAWRGDPHEAEVADTLKTTPRLLRVRMNALHPSERGRLTLMASMREGAA